MNSEVIPIPGCDMYTRTFGTPASKALLCLHSLFLNGGMFYEWAESVSDELFVVVPDFRGQGRSANLEHQSILDMDLYAADIQSFIDVFSRRHSVDTYGLLAQSMGGDVGLRVAYNNPERINSVALLGSSACDEPPNQLQDFHKWVKGVEASGFTGDALEYTYKVMLGETCRNDPQRSSISEGLRAQLAQLDLDLLPAMRGVVERTSVMHHLHNITIPTLIISGQEDWVRPPSWSAAMHAELPNSELISLANVGHSPILESPEIVFPMLREFFVNNLFEQVDAGV